VKNRSPLAIAPSQASHRLDRERVRELFSQTLRYDDDGVRLGARSIYTDAEIFQLQCQDWPAAGSADPRSGWRDPWLLECVRSPRCACLSSKDREP